MKPFWWPSFSSAAFLSDIFRPLIATHGLGSKHLACDLGSQLVLLNQTFHPTKKVFPLVSQASLLLLDLFGRLRSVWSVWSVVVLPCAMTL